MKKSEQINELASALAKAQGEMQNVQKDAENPFFGARFASLAAVWDTIRLPLSKNGLSLVQTTDYEGEKITVMSLLLHSSGQWLEGRLPVITQKVDSQSIGSAISYMRRYGAMAMVGVAPEDDDGEAAMQRPAAKPQPAQTPRPAATPRPNPSPASAQQTAPAQGELSASLQRMRTPGAMPSRP